MLSLPIKLDFGTGTSPLASGWTRATVTLYTAARGHGWASKTGIVAVYNKDLDPLAADFHRGSGPGRYLIDVPPGDYQITVRMADPGWRTNIFNVGPFGGMTLPFQDTLPLTWTETVTGQLGISLSVVAGYWALASLEIAAVPVVPPLAIVSMQVTPAAPLAGQDVDVVVQVEGGTPRYSYAWDDGDGELSVQPVLETVYDAGEYTITVIVTDAAGQTALATLTLTVAPLSPPLPGLDVPGLVIAVDPGRILSQFPDGPAPVDAEGVHIPGDGSKLTLTLPRSRMPYLTGSFLVRFRPEGIVQDRRTVAASAAGSPLQMPAFSVGIGPDGVIGCGSGSLQKTVGIVPQDVLGTTPVLSGDWHTLCVVWDPQRKRLCVDGVLEGVLDTNAAGLAQITEDDYFKGLAPDAPMTVDLGGADWFNGAQGAPFVGTISHVLLAGVPWDAAQVAAATAFCTPAPPPPPPPGTSSNGTRVPPAAQITDAAGAVWTLAGNVVQRNGAQASGGLGSLILWWAGRIYVQAGVNWYRWATDRWEFTGTDDPSGVPPPPPPDLLPAPTGFAATLRADGSAVDLAWDAVPGAVAYVLHRSDDGTDPDELPPIATIPGGNT